MVSTRQYFRLFTILIVALIAIIIFLAFFSNWSSVQVPHIRAGSGETSPIIATHTYPFENVQVTFEIPVDTQAYEGAKNADKSVTIRGNVSEKVWLSRSYEAMINDSAQDGMYRDITGEFRKIKDGQQYSDDEYVELITGYVQSFRYLTKADTPAKFPLETVVDEAGDCDDKSLLLAGLLSHEEYKVALLSFGPEAHMAVGIGSPDTLYKDTGYSFIETTNFSFIGIPPAMLEGGVVLMSEPVVIPIGTGTKEYHSGKETSYISEQYLISETRAGELETQADNLRAELDGTQARIAELENRMQQLKSEGNLPAYNGQVPAHNALVSEYNAGLATLRDLNAKHNAYAAIHNYILDHGYDRKGVYQYVVANMPV